MINKNETRQNMNFTIYSLFFGIFPEIFNIFNYLKEFKHITKNKKSTKHVSAPLNTVYHAVAC